jgi:hypothetical protein
MREGEIVLNKALRGFNACLSQRKNFRIKSRKQTQLTIFSKLAVQNLAKAVQIGNSLD